MLVLPQEIKVKWIVLSKDWFISKGYIFTKYKDEFKVDVRDLPSMSNKIIKV